MRIWSNQGGQPNVFPNKSKIIANKNINSNLVTWSLERTKATWTLDDVSFIKTWHSESYFFPGTGGPESEYYVVDLFKFYFPIVTDRLTEVSHLPGSQSSMNSTFEPSRFSSLNLIVRLLVRITEQMVLLLMLTSQKVCHCVCIYWTRTSSIFDKANHYANSGCNGTVI